MKFSRKWILVLVAVAVIAAFAYLLVPQSVPEKKIARDIQMVNARFTPSESIDLSMAMKMVTHDPPQMLNPPAAPPPMLLFPPSQQTLEELSGGQVISSP